MDNLPPEILNYLNTQRVGVLSVEMPDGSPHGATVHFAHSDNPLVFYFETGRSYMKSQAIMTKKVTRASFVVGTNEAEMKTAQFDGSVEELSQDEMPLFQQFYLEKFPEKRSKSNLSEYLFFKFIPKWWRFTDWKTPQGKKIWSSEFNK